MRIHIDYEDYVLKYGGGFPFPDGTYTNDNSDRNMGLLASYSRKAIAQLERYKRIYRVTEPVNAEQVDGGMEIDLEPEKAAVCAMIEVMMIHDAARESAVNRVSSASIGSVSVSYGSPSGVDVSEKALEKELFQCASRYLDIYRGVG